MKFYGMHPASDLDLLLKRFFKTFNTFKDLKKRLRIVQQNHHKKYALDFITILKKCHES